MGAPDPPRLARTRQAGHSDCMTDPASIVGDPLWLAHRYDAQDDSFRFRHVSRDQHRAATFLTDEYLGPETTPVILARSTAIAAAPRAAPLHFIFHSAFCGSTLLARAFDLEGVAMALKEPVLLNDMAGWQQRGGSPRAIAGVLDDSLTLLARPFAPGEAVVIKPSNLLNAMAPAMLAMRPEARAVLLHAPLPIFLKSVAKKGLWGRLWVRDLMAKQIGQGIIQLGFDAQSYLRLSDLQAAAVGWLAQHALFAQIEAAHSARVLALDSEALIDRPAIAIAQVATLFGLEVDAQAIAEGPAFTQHSKFGQAFDPAQRNAEYAAAYAAHGDEIEKILVWAQSVARNAGLTI